MKKLMLVLVALMALMSLAFVLPASAQAQSPNPGDACNTTYAVKGVPQTGLTVAIVIGLTGNGSTPSAEDLQELKNDIVVMANQSLAEAGEKVQLTLLSDPAQANLIFNFNIVYNTDGTGTAYLEVRGLGVGHLFRYSRTGQTAGDATVIAVTSLPGYLGPNGWTCEAN
jgi:hypothetical protein